MIAIISDIHANLEALVSVIEDIKQFNVEDIYCLGDIIGYGANPNEVIDIIIKNDVRAIKGNHERACLTPSNIKYFNPAAGSAIMWTLNRLTNTSMKFIRSLPDTMRNGNILFVHGSPLDPDEYITNTLSVNSSMQYLSQNSIAICFFGHTHIKALYPSIAGYIPDDWIYLDNNKHYLINPGAVGQPRDGDIDASYILFDEENYRVLYRMVSYDIELAQKKIIEAGLPSFLARRLSVGR